MKNEILQFAELAETLSEHAQNELTDLMKCFNDAIREKNFEIVITSKFHTDFLKSFLN